MGPASWREDQQNPDLPLHARNAVGVAEGVEWQCKSYEDTTIQPGKTYYYMITSVNKVNRESEMTDAVKVR